MGDQPSPEKKLHGSFASADNTLNGVIKWVIPGDF